MLNEAAWTRVRAYKAHQHASFLTTGVRRVLLFELSASSRAFNQDMMNQVKTTTLHTYLDLAHQGLCFPLITRIDAETSTVHRLLLQHPCLGRTILKYLTLPRWLRANWMILLQFGYNDNPDQPLPIIEHYAGPLSMTHHFRRRLDKRVHFVKDPNAEGYLERRWRCSGTYLSQPRKEEF